ncbi:MAG: class F sortase [Ornithinimicrobium sp.]
MGRLLVALCAAALVAAGCGSAQAVDQGSQQSEPSTQGTHGGHNETADSNEAATTPEQARTGTPAASERLRFQPTRLQLPDGSDAPVQPVSTVDGELVVPENVDRLGWWDGGAYVNDPFGSTVIAGHIDSAEQGVGFFGKLLAVTDGDQVMVHGEDGELAYTVTSTDLVNKDVLVDDTVAFDQTGEHRLVLITCSGRWIPERNSYESNFIVVAEPNGLAQPRS